MPTYEYACTNPECGHTLSAVQAFTEDSLTECPVCGGRLRKVFGTVGVMFRARGFCRNDSRQEAKKSAASNGKSAAKTSEHQLVRRQGGRGEVRHLRHRPQGKTPPRRLTAPGSHGCSTPSGAVHKRVGVALFRHRAGLGSAAWSTGSSKRCAGSGVEPRCASDVGPAASWPSAASRSRRCLRSRLPTEPPRGSPSSSRGSICPPGCPYAPAN